MNSDFERREYTRFPVTDKKIVFYVDNNEYFGDIIDVSENGFKVKVSSKISGEKRFTFQFYYNTLNDNDPKGLIIVNGNGLIVRYESDDVIGCQVQANEELSRFVRQIIIELYKNRIE